ncbi:MAG: substrate-binding domain-containing protein [Spirochaetaceae bacterium]|jgi:phosphate transport system substrate-binding protein|nr:substrate-binding domain-containing protein [Spirochaetaceae bacterium]
MENNARRIIKRIVSSLIGIGLSFVSFFAFILLLFFTERNILMPLLALFYISIIVFLVLWNRQHTKGIFFLLCIPVLSILSGWAVITYNNHIRAIPTVSEQHFPLYKYIPFDQDNILAKLGEASALQFFDNLPVLDGATALYPVYAAFAQAVYPEPPVAGFDELVAAFDESVLCSRTAGAFNNLLEGKADIIFCAEPSKEQLQRFYDTNMHVKLVPIGKEAFVFFVNTENTISNITAENIRDIYSGKIHNWKELGGINQRIKAFQRPQNSGSQTMLEKIMGDTGIEKPRRENVPYGMGDIINEVANYRNFSNAIGFSFLYFSTEMVQNDQIKLLSIDGIYPSRETIQNNTYPYSDVFYAIYIDRDDMNDHIIPFIDWILSEQGQELILKSGYTPIKSP